MVVAAAVTVASCQRNSKLFEFFFSSLYFSSISSFISMVLFKFHFMFLFFLNDDHDGFLILLLDRSLLCPSLASQLYELNVYCKNRYLLKKKGKIQPEPL